MKLPRPVKTPDLSNLDLEHKIFKDCLEEIVVVTIQPIPGIAQIAQSTQEEIGEGIAQSTPRVDGEGIA